MSGQARLSGQIRAVAPSTDGSHTFSISDLLPRRRLGFTVDRAGAEGGGTHAAAYSVDSYQKDLDRMVAEAIYGERSLRIVGRHEASGR